MARFRASIMAGSMGEDMGARSVFFRNQNGGIFPLF
jgi:hypothetical protein